MSDKIHLKVYSERCELHNKGSVTIYKEGLQSKETEARYNKLKETLNDKYLDKLYDNNLNVSYQKLDAKYINLLRNLVDGITSEVGRALVGLTFLQLTIKSIIPDQSIRLHKGGNRAGSFSWENGISMRSIDSKYNTPFLREYGLLSINKDGIMMTRSLAENYPYTRLYKAEMRGPFKEWIDIVDAVEDGAMPPILSLNYLLSLLINRSKRVNDLADRVITLAESYEISSIQDIKKLLSSFFDNAKYSARAFEVVIHALMQVLTENEYIEYKLAPLSQMRSANKKHGNIGDIELIDGNCIIESWDAKYGKPYLYEELGELSDKLDQCATANIAGFIVDKDLSTKPEIDERRVDISDSSGVEILLFNFSEWVDYQIMRGPDISESKLAKDWLLAVVESFALKKIDIAPIDEPCEVWLMELERLLKQ